MTINTIKTLNIKSAELLKKITERDIRQAIEEPLTLGLLADDTNGMGEMYAKNFVASMVDYICDSFQRREPMEAEDRKDLAELILRRNMNLTIVDCKVFAEMCVAGEINTGSPGRDEYKLIDVNKAGILDKLRVYKVRRAEMAYRMEEEFKQSMKESTETGRHPLTQYQLTHDYSGREMPPGWNAEAYWRSQPTQHELETIIMPRLKSKMASMYAKKD